MTDIRTQIPGSSMPFSTASAWAMEPAAFEALRETMTTLSPERISAAAALSAAERNSDPGYDTRGGVAVLSFAGVVTKQPTVWSRIFGGKAVTTDTTRALSNAVADPAVNSILMVIDSPGGTVDGTADLADAVHEANAVKPVTAYAQDTMASAAYWIGSTSPLVISRSASSKRSARSRQTSAPRAASSHRDL